ncbi:unnamed protein product, partial [Scytosiphon promiscuus]
MTPQHGRLASPPVIQADERCRVMHRTKIASSSAVAQCGKRRDSRMQQSSMTLGCICALLRPPRGAAWGGHVVAEGLRHAGDAFTPRRNHKHHQQQQQQQQQLQQHGASLWWRCGLKHRLGESRSPRRGNRRRRVLMSVIVADGSSSGGGSGGGGGSIDEAAASSTSPPFSTGDETPTPRLLPSSQPPIPRRTAVNGDVVDPTPAGASAASKSAGRSTYINTGSSAPKRRRPRTPAEQQQQQQQQPAVQSSGENQEETQHESSTITPELELEQQEQEQRQQEIRRLGKAGRWRDVLELLASIRAPSRAEYVAAIAACDYAGEPRQALRVHALMLERGIKPSPESVLLVVRGLCQAGDAPTALRVFNSSGVRLRGRRYKPGPTLTDSASAMNTLYAVMIRAAQKAGDWREAVLLYREAEGLDPGPSAATATAVFLACYAEQEYAAAVSFASDALRPPWEEVTHRRVLMNKIIVACGRAGPDHYRQALDTYRDLDRTVGADGYTLTAVIDVLRRVGDWRRALPLLDRLAALGVPADRGLRTSVNAVLSAMGPENYRGARELAQRAAVDWGVDGDIVTYGTLLLLASARLPPPAPLVPAGGSAEGTDRGVSKASRRSSRGGDGAAGGEGERVLEEQGGGGWETVTVLRWAVAAKAVPSEACLDMVVFGLARDGLWEEASAFVGAIEESGLKVSRHQREALLSSLANGERWRDVVAVVESMLADSVIVDNATAGLAMKAYTLLGLKGQWASALSLMERAQQASAGSADVTDASAWRCLFAGLASQGLHEEAGVAMRAMVEAGVRVDKDSSAAVVVAAHDAGDHAAALAWVDRLRGAGLPVSRNGYSAAVNACCALGKPEAAIGVLEVMLESKVVPSASVYNAVLETICPPSEGGYSARARLRDDDEAFSGGGVETAAGGGGGGANGLDGVGEGAGGERKDAQEGGGGGQFVGQGRDPGSAAGVKADRALSLFEDMWARAVPMNGVTYAMVICALLRAEREDDVLRLWEQAWSDRRTKKLRRDMANRVLGICKAQRRGGLAVRLLEVGARLAPKGRGDVAWPGPGPYWAAMEACEREGATAWRDALDLIDMRDASPLRPDYLFSEAAATVVQNAAAVGIAGAVEAASTRVWRKLSKDASPSGIG